MCVVGFDTSNYTTSVAYYDGREGENVSQLLPVRQGELGLRQSDAVFAHIKSLPALSGRLFSHFPGNIKAVGVSTRPRAVEGSYMPCFMVGYSHASSQKYLFLSLFLKSEPTFAPLTVNGRKRAVIDRNTE